MNPWERDWSQAAQAPWERDWRAQPAEKQNKVEPEDPGALMAGVIGAGRITDKVTSGLEHVVRSGAKSVADFLGSNDYSKFQQGQLDRLAEEQRSGAQAYKTLEAQHPIATTVGEIAPSMLTRTPIGMALLAASEYGSPEERAKHGGLTFAGGKLGELAGQGIAKLAGRKSVTGEGMPFDIPLTVAQRTQSKPAQIAESVLANVPGASGVMAKAGDATFGGFNRAVARSFGEDTTKLSPELYGAAKGRIGGVFNDVAERNSMKFDEPLFNDLLRVQERAKMELTPPEADLVTNWTNRIVRDVNPEGELAGKIYKAYDSKLGQLAKQSKGTLADVYGDLRQSMRTHMDRNISPADADKWAVARRQYLNLQTVANAAKNSGDGSMSPARLLQEVNSSQKNAKFGAGNELAQLAQYAKTNLPDKIPNSGTAQRLLYQKILTNPVSSLAAVGGLGYGANSLGIEPADAAGGLLVPYIAARALAGKPATKETEELLKRLGVGLLGTTALQTSR